MSGEDEPKSSDRDLCDAICPKAARVKTRLIGLTFEQLKTLMPECVRLARVDDIFRAWKEAHDNLLPADRVQCNLSISRNDEQRTHLHYEFDSHTYLSSLYYYHPRDTRRQSEFCIKLANDDFIYPHTSTLETNPNYDTSQNYHNGTGWNLLSTETLESHFQSIVQFANSFHGTDSIDGAVLYNENMERMDFRFKLSDPNLDKVRLEITFEPGYPSHWHNDDFWGALGKGKIGELQQKDD
jgi:hypothetical protein